MKQKFMSLNLLQLEMFALHEVIKKSSFEDAMVFCADTADLSVKLLCK